MYVILASVTLVRPSEYFIINPITGTSYLRAYYFSFFINIRFLLVLLPRRDAYVCFLCQSAPRLSLSIPTQDGIYHTGGEQVL